MLESAAAFLGCCAGALRMDPLRRTGPGERFRSEPGSALNRAAAGIDCLENAPKGQGFRHGFGAGVLVVRQVGEGSGHAKHTSRAPCRELSPVHGPPEQRQGRIVGADRSIQISIWNPGVGGMTSGVCFLAGLCDAIPGFGAGRTGGRRAQGCPGNAPDGHAEVDAIQEGAREFAPIASERRVIAAAIPIGGSVVAAGAGVGRGDQLKARREFAAVASARDPNHPLFQHFAKRLEAAPVELREFIEKQHALVGEGHFARLNRMATTEEARGACAVVRCAKGRMGEVAGAGRELSRRIQNAKGFDLGLFFEGGQQPSEAPRKERLAGARRTHEEKAMPPRRPPP